MVRSLDRFLDEYYQLRNWTRNGLPTRRSWRNSALGVSQKTWRLIWRVAELKEKTGREGGRRGIYPELLLSVGPGAVTLSEGS